MARPDDHLLNSSVPTEVEIDLRAVVRQFCLHAAPIRVLVRPSYRCLPASVRDVSVKGIGLRCEVPLPTGNQLALEWNFGAPNRQRIVLARVIHATWSAEHGWLIGCEFLTPLADADIETLLTARPV